MSYNQGPARVCGPGFRIPGFPALSRRSTSRGGGFCFLLVGVVDAPAGHAAARVFVVVADGALNVCGVAGQQGRQDGAVALQNFLGREGRAPVAEEQELGQPLAGPPRQLHQQVVVRT